MLIFFQVPSYLWSWPSEIQMVAFASIHKAGETVTIQKIDTVRNIVSPVFVSSLKALTTASLNSWLLLHPAAKGTHNPTNCSSNQSPFQQQLLRYKLSWVTLLARERIQKWWPNCNKPDKSGSTIRKWEYFSNPDSHGTSTHSERTHKAISLWE